MTDEECTRESVEEAIEDLDAPQEAQRDVVGGTLWKDIKTKADPPGDPVPYVDPNSIGASRRYFP